MAMLNCYGFEAKKQWREAAKAQKLPFGGQHDWMPG
jgi:hypothetical protein